LSFAKDNDVENRVLAIGDIHGCHVALRSLLEHIAPNESDTVVVLGDLVDRGPDSKDVLDQLISLSHKSKFIGILGNHDEMLLNAIANNTCDDVWMSKGGTETLVSYLGSLANIPQEHVDFISGFRDYWSTETDIFVHAKLDPDLPLEEQSTQMLRWNRLTGNETPHRSGKRVICGHTGLPTGTPGILNGYVDIDTWAYGGKWLTCLDTSTDEVYQSTQQGAIRGPLPLVEIATDYTKRDTS
jgi:serine/threonine protein phosphatase 1